MVGGSSPATLFPLLLAAMVAPASTRFTMRLREAQAVEAAAVGDAGRYGPRCGAPAESSLRKKIKAFCAPSFLIIGFGRCGTTSLARYLTKHPRLSFGTRKEHFYFYRPEFCDLQHGANNGSRCALEAYASQFPVFRREPDRDVTFDATPMLGGDMGVPASDRTMGWLRSRLPDLKLVVVVKSPADRFMSNPLASNKVARFQESLGDGTNAMPRKLRQLLLDNCYVAKLEAWLRHFPPSRFLLLHSEDLRVEANRQPLLDEVHAFLGVEPHERGGPRPSSRRRRRPEEGTSAAGTRPRTCRSSATTTSSRTSPSAPSSGRRSTASPSSRAARRASRGPCGPRRRPRRTSAGARRRAASTAARRARSSRGRCRRTGCRRRRRTTPPRRRPAPGRPTRTR